MNAEIIGAAASVFTIASFAVKGEARIRAINLIACVAFVAYGIVLKAPSLCITNGTIAIIHIARLWRNNYANH